MLSIMCDNASNNDAMVKHLATLVENFPGPANQTRCFTHILNLVAKSILRQFNVAKKATGASTDLNEASDALASLALELEDHDSASPGGDDEECDDDDEEGNDEDGDDVAGLGDGRDGMLEDEVAELEESLVPVRLMLVKVSPITYFEIT
jgi:hypothetical protein